MRRRDGLILGAALGLIGLAPGAPAAAQGRPRKLAPRDEGGRDPALKAVIDALLAAAQAKSVDRLRPLLADDVRESFGGDGTPEEFVAAFRKKPALWAELEKALKLGGTFMRPTIYAAPYVYSEFPDGLDAHRHVVVLGTNVPLHEAPRDPAIVAQRLTHDIVRIERPETGVRLPNDWLRVRPSTGNAGYIRKSLVRSPVDYRIVIEKRAAKWLVTAFVGGD